MTNVSLYLTESADMYPGAPALRCDGATTTHSELADQAARLAAYLAERGVQPGDRVGIMLASRPEFAAAFYGVLHAGAVVVPMNPRQSAHEVAFYLTNTGARILFSAPACTGVAIAAARAAGAAAVEVDGHTMEYLMADVAGPPRPVTRGADDTAVILHTDDATGVPKGAQLTHRNLVTNQAVTARSLLDLGPDDVVLGCLPLFEAFGMTCGLLAAISTGATLALLPRFDPANALELIAAERVTVFQGAPFMYAAMLRTAPYHALDFGSLRVCISGGAAMPADVLRRFEDRFGCTVLEGYGLAETSPAACFNHPGAVRKSGSIGTPIDGVQMRVVDEYGTEVPAGTVGEIQIRGHNVMKGYWNLPQATAAAINDGWFATGDIGRIDGEGYFFIVNRTHTPFGAGRHRP
jgi:long-chain acyl-CoA synthetase